MDPVVAVLIAYAAGCLSFARLVCRIKGVDISTHGSGNPGATNVGRILGRRWGAAVLLLDVAKGFVPVWLLAGPTLFDPGGHVTIAMAAVLGHVFPVLFGLRGGKGVATLVGALLALDARLAVLSIVAHYLFRRVTGFVSVASVVLAWAFPVCQLLARATGFDQRFGLFVQGTLGLALLALLITARHVDNFRRIRAGTEDRYDAHAPHPAIGDEGVAERVAAGARSEPTPAPTRED